MTRQEELAPTIPTRSQLGGIADPDLTMPGKDNIAIWTRDLTREFDGEVVVQNITMAIPRGKIFGFIGPSGSGKTTTLRLLTGVYRPTSGEVSVLGVPPADFTQTMRERIGYMPQLYVLYSNLSVWENLNFAASLYGMGLRRNHQLNEVLDFVELREHRGKLARNISGGMQRRLSLAATLVHDPELIFLDEPTAGIDPILRRKFWDHFTELRDSGRTLFVTTQYVSEAAYCDLVGVISEGRLLSIDTPEGLRHRAFGGDIVNFTSENSLDIRDLQEMRHLPFIRNIRSLSDTDLRLIVNDAATDIPALVSWCEERECPVKAVEEYMPPFDDVFVEIVKEGANRA
jgi:ABC-2 type transport system ATP-binding protein